jgi:hypothetical protein
MPFHPTSFPQETAATGRPPGPHPLPFGWKAAPRLSTGLDSAKPNPHPTRPPTIIGILMPAWTGGPIGSLFWFELPVQEVRGPLTTHGIPYVVTQLFSRWTGTRQVL